MRWTACLLLVACSSSYEPMRGLRFPSATPEQYAAASDAVEDWNKACGLGLTLTRAIGDWEIVLVPQGSLGGHAGRANLDQERIEIDATFSTTRELYAHEIGHALGLDHRERGIMREHWFFGTHVTASDCQ